MDHDKIILPILAILGVIAVIALLWYFVRRAETILKKWANENGLEILEKKQRYLIFTGPFKFGTSSRNQIIYFFRVRDKDRNEKTGWARCGSFWGGVFFSDKIEIRWE